MNFVSFDVRYTGSNTLKVSHSGSLSIDTNPPKLFTILRIWSPPNPSCDELIPTTPLETKSEREKSAGRGLPLLLLYCQVNFSC